MPLPSNKIPHGNNPFANDVLNRLLSLQAAAEAFKQARDNMQTCLEGGSVGAVLATLWGGDSQTDIGNGIYLAAQAAWTQMDSVETGLAGIRASIDQAAAEMR